MTTLLAIDTATEACSVALLYNDEFYNCYEVIPRLHAQRVLSMVQQVLTEADCTLAALDGIAVGQGPGAFTGLRIATGVVQGLAFALDKPIVTISDLAVIAQRAWRQYQTPNVAVSIDARMDEVYWGCYQLQDNMMRLVGVEQVLSPEAVMLPDVEATVWHGVGTGWRYANKMIDCKVLDDMLLPDSQDLLTLALDSWTRDNYISADKLEPIYLRDNVATPKKPMI